MQGTKKEKIWIEIHQICGDCGRRIKEKFDLENNSLKEIIRIVKLYYPKYNMACGKCSNRQEQKPKKVIKCKKGGCPKGFINAENCKSCSDFKGIKHEVSGNSSQS